MNLINNYIARTEQNDAYTCEPGGESTESSDAESSGGEYVDINDADEFTSCMVFNTHPIENTGGCPVAISDTNFNTSQMETAREEGKCETYHCNI